MNGREVSNQTRARPLQTWEANEGTNRAQLIRQMVVSANSHSPPKKQKLSNNDNNTKSDVDLKTTLYHCEVAYTEKDPQQIT